jgi:integral membrane protein
MIKNNVKKFGQINSIEGYSYLLLLFIAMPMKYAFGYPMAVKIVGMIHGILFIIFCYLLLKAWNEAKWEFKESVIFFIASLIPFGTFYTKSKIKAYE